MQVTRRLPLGLTMARATKKYRGYSKRIERNILSVYIRANEYDRAEGLHWYGNARDSAEVIAHKHGITAAQSIGVIAAMSPGLNWGLNLIQAEELIKAYVSGLRGNDLPRLGTYGRRNIVKACRILDGESPLAVLGGDKVRSFYQNILDPQGLSAVTIDRHAKGLAVRSNSAKGATSGEDAIVTHAEYPYYAKHYIKLAERLGLIPNQLQAICWVTWRRLKGELAQEDLPF